MNTRGGEGVIPTLSSQWYVSYLDLSNSFRVRSDRTVRLFSMNTPKQDWPWRQRTKSYEIQCVKYSFGHHTCSVERGSDGGYQMTQGLVPRDVVTRALVAPRTLKNIRSRTRQLRPKTHTSSPP